jgi:hypothetical protein
MELLAELIKWVELWSFSRVDVDREWVVFGLGRLDPTADQVQFTAVEQLPLDFFASFQADGGDEGQ